MLKITIQHHTDHDLLTLEGAISGPWTEELRQHLSIARPPVRIDLTGITFMDDQATSLLETAIKNGATLSACSHFAALMLQQIP